MSEDTPRLVTLDTRCVHMRAAQDVYGAKSNLLISRGTLLTEKIINRLKQHSITHILAAPEASGCNRIVEEAIESLRALYKDVRAGKSLNKAAVKGNVNQMVRKIFSEPQVANVLLALKNYDRCTYTHSVNVSVFAALMAKEAGFHEEDVQAVATAGLLHDVGKCFIPTEVLNKQGALDQDESRLMKTHPEKGYRYLKSMGYQESICTPVLQHHERMDGGGYPQGIKQLEIHPHSRMVAVADCYDALTYDRPYRKAIDPLQSLRIMRESMGRELCPITFKMLLKTINIFPPETRFVLRSGVELGSWEVDGNLSPVFRFDSCQVNYKDIAHLIADVVV